MCLDWNQKSDQNSEGSSYEEFSLSVDIFIRKVGQNKGKQKNVRDSEEFKLNGNQDIMAQLYIRDKSIRHHPRLCRTQRKTGYCWTLTSEFNFRHREHSLSSCFSKQGGELAAIDYLLSCCQNNIVDNYRLNR